MNTPTFDQICPDAGAGAVLPAIIQDDRTLRVLAHGCMNREAYEKSLAEGRVTLWNGAENALCPVGDADGNYLEIISATPSDGADALLLRVLPHGTAGSSCFCGGKDSDEGFIRLLQSVIQGRHRDMPEGSYTTYLFNKGVNKIAQKVGEEAVETVIEAVAGNHERLIYEASDLIYHLLVLMEATGHSIADLEAELVKRHK